jgi:hypothetical protein
MPIRYYLISKTPNMFQLVLFNRVYRNISFGYWTAEKFFGYFFVQY